MSSRARPTPGRTASALALALAASLAACTNDATPIAPEPFARRPLDERAPSPKDDRTTKKAPPDHPAPEHQGVQVESFTIEYAPLGFKIALAVPQGGHLCIILPESAQEPTACMGLDPQAMIDALPQGPGRPFGVAHARGGDWSYDVILSPTPENVEAREDIELLVNATEAAVREATSLVPKVIAEAPGQRFDLLRVKDLPVVRFRIETPHAPDSPAYDQAATLYYAGYGAKAALVTFITSPKDIDKVLPYAEASIQTMTLPAREAPERFGKPRDELNQRGTRLALTIFGPLVAFGILLFWWLGRSRDKQAADAKAAEERAIRERDKSEAAGDRNDDDGEARDNDDDGEARDNDDDGEARDNDDDERDNDEGDDDERDSDKRDSDARDGDDEDSGARDNDDGKSGDDDRGRGQ